MRRPGKEKAELLEDDPDDIRENIMYYDEEGAGQSLFIELLFLE